MPVSQVEIATYKPGKVSKALHSLYKEEVKNYITTVKGRKH